MRIADAAAGVAAGAAGDLDAARGADEPAIGGGLLHRCPLSPSRACPRPVSTRFRFAERRRRSASCRTKSGSLASFSRMSNRRLISLRISLVAKLAASSSELLPRQAGLFDRAAALRGLIDEPADRRRRATTSSTFESDLPDRAAAGPRAATSAAPSRRACGRRAFRSGRRRRRACRTSKTRGSRRRRAVRTLPRSTARTGVPGRRAPGRRRLRPDRETARPAAWPSCVRALPTGRVGIGCGDSIGGSFSRSWAFSGRRSES